MAETLTATEFDRRDLPGWRYLLGGIEATFSLPSFARAADFVSRIGAAAGAAGHHPDVNLRPPGTVQVRLATHEVDGVTEADVELAGEISALATGSAEPGGPSALTRLEVAIDAMDIDAVRPFWQAVLGYEPAPARPDGTIDAVIDPRGVSPAFWFQQMDEPRPQRNRIHIDVTVPHDLAEERIAGALAAGGRLVSDEAARAFWILADPEGNEACICTWQDRH